MSILCIICGFGLRNISYWFWKRWAHITLMWAVTFQHVKVETNGCHFTDDIFKCILFNEHLYILIRIAMKFVSKDSIPNMAVLVQVKAWCQTGDKPLSEPIMAKCPCVASSLAPNRRQAIIWTTENPGYWCHVATMNKMKDIFMFYFCQTHSQAPQHQ